MKVEIQSLNFSLIPAQSRYVERRLDLALGACSDHIERVEVWLSEVHVAGSNVLKRCLIQVELKRKTIVVSESIDSDPRVAIHRAADQASWKIPRCLGRQEREASLRLSSTQRLVENRLRSEYMMQ